MNTVQHIQDPIRMARLDRARMLDAARNLEQALSRASFARERAWGTRISELLTITRTALRETRQSADSKGSLLEELGSQFPHLLARVNLLRNEYKALQQQMEMLHDKIDAQPSPDGGDVEWIREKLAVLLNQLRRIQSNETELVFEAYNVDIGVGD